MNGVFFLFLIYSAFTMNLLLQCALGINGVADSRIPFNKFTIVKTGLIFLSIILLWFLFSRILYSVSSGFFIYVLLFPVSVIVYNGLEYHIFRYILKTDTQSESVVSFPGGITAVALFICINISDKFFDTVVLSFGFTSGILLINFIIWEIRKRASLEAVPVFLRGKPLVLIAMGIISLVFSTASILLFRMIGAG